MTKYPLLLLLFFTFKDLTGQIFGNTLWDDPQFFNSNYIVGFKIETGPSDSGVFTHIGWNDDPAYTPCAIKVGLYSHDANNNTPLNLLTEETVSNPVNGIINQVSLSTQPTLQPSTFYWIAIRTSCGYYVGDLMGTNWAQQPGIYRSWAYGSGWPSPLTGESSFTIPNMAIFAVGNGQILPVELLSFKVDLDNRTPNLSWQVASELNNEGWHIQRSTNGFTWQSIDWIDGKGTSDHKHTYYYEDEKAPTGLIFYRLQQRDFDGTIAHSEVESIYIEPIKITLYPNPAQNKIHLQGPNIGSSYEIRDVFGNQVQESFFCDKFEIDISNLNAGAYYLLLTDTNQNIPFIKK